jgi:formylglycine-generating enzyme required for sulfatase activity
MLGNVWEWCEDAWHDNYEGAPDDGRVWADDAAEGGRRVSRGGGWAGHARRCRCACRFGWRPGFRDGELGFRFVLAATFNEGIRAFP